MDSWKTKADVAQREIIATEQEKHGASYNTKFLIENLHCTSCIYNIENAFNRLVPQPLSISHSIVSQFVSVNHYEGLTVQGLSRALDEAGYEIFDIISDAPHEIAPNSIVRQEFNFAGRLALHQSWNYWGLGNEGRSKKRKRHTENCEHCRREQRLEEDGETEQSTKKRQSTSECQSIDETAEQSEETAEKRFVDRPRVDVGAEPARTDVRTEIMLEVKGMTCSSCVNNVTEALKEVPCVEMANVNLLTHIATVKCTGNAQIDQIISAVEDRGYNASFLEKTPVSSRNNVTEDFGDSLIKATLSVEGMTCSSCTNSLHSALNALDFVASVEVNLVTSSAIVILKGQDRTPQLIEVVEDIGFEATVTDVVPLGGISAHAESRKIQLTVKGMYCQHCPMKIREGILKQFGDLVYVEQSLSLNKPIALEYKPQQPRVTISSIIDSIQSIDPAFSVTVYHPTSIEERSMQMHLKEQRRILYRLILSVCAAIPTFIIGIVYMNLLPSDNPGRRYLMTELSGVSRAIWSLFLMATPVYFLAADIFHRRALKEIWILWRPGSKASLFRRFMRFGSMSMLISLGTTVAYFSSIVELAVIASNSNGRDISPSQYFDSVVFLTMFLLLGRFTEAFSKSKTNDAVKSLGKLRPTHCLKEEVTVTGGDRNFQECPAELLEFGDLIKVLHGGTPAADGIIMEGSTTFDESCLTGESKPVPKTLGDSVFSGTVNQGQSVCIRVTGVAGTSMLDRIMDIIREGQTQRAPVERIAGVVTAHFVPLVTAIAVVTWIIWLSLGLSGILPDSYRDTSSGGWTFWSLEFAIATFVIACPCGIGLAAPTALFVAGGLAAKHGILVKGGGEAFQEASKLNSVVFDKTGTLTVGGNPTVTDFEYVESEHYDTSQRNDILAAVKYLEQESSHPIARALVAFADAESTTTNNTGVDIEEIPGKGMKGVFIFGDDINEARTQHTIVLGNERLMKDYGVELSEVAAETLLTWECQGKSVVCLATSSESSSVSRSVSRIRCLFAIADPIRPEAHQVIHELQRRHIDVWMLTGDNSTTAHAVGKTLGISPANIIAGVMPEDKASKIKYLQQSIHAQPSQSLASRISGLWGFKPSESNTKSSHRALVAMVGDGINDAPALATADVGIAMGSGTDIALHTSKFILLQSSLTTLLTLLSLSSAVIRRIKFNFAWALIYNVIGIPIAAGVLYPIVSNGKHIRLDPAWAALAMAASSVSVVLSSLALRSRIPLLGFRIPKTTGHGSAGDTANNA